MERSPKNNHNEHSKQDELAEQQLDPRALEAFEFLTNNVDLSDKTYDEIMDSDENLDEMRTVRHRRGRYSSQNTLYMSELLVGSKYSDNKFWNELVEKVDELPKDMKPDQIVVSGLYMGDFGGRHKNSRWMLKPGLRTLGSQFKAGKEKLDQLKELGIPVTYTRSDNDTQIIEEMTFDAFREMEMLSKEHAKQAEDSVDTKRQLSRAEKYKANPNWPEYYRFTKYVAFPYCMRTGRELRSADEVSELTDGKYNQPEREILFTAYKRVSRGGRLTDEHKSVLELDALQDSRELTIVGDFEHQTNTRKNVYVDLVRHKMQTSNVPLANYFRKPENIRGALAAEGEDPYDNIILTGSQEAAGVFRPDNEAIHSIGGMQDPKRTLREDGDILTSSANTVARPIFGRGRFHDPSATAIERTDDGRQIVTVFNRKLMEVSESIEERTTLFMQCDWQAGNIASRPDYQVKQLDMVRQQLGRGAVVLGLGGDILEGNNYPSFQYESGGYTGLTGMDQQVDFVTQMIERSLDDLTKEEIENLVVRATIGNHEWNSGTLKVNGYSFADNFTGPYKAAFMARGYSLDEAKDRVTFQDTTVTEIGEPLKTYSTRFNIGEMGFELRHFFGAGKGTGGQPPAFAGYRRQQTQGDLHRNTDVGIFGHYHHPNYMVGGNKLYIGSGALNGLTGFEYEKGLRPAKSVVMLHVGGGLPPQIEVLGEKYLRDYKIKDGYFSDKEIRERHGFRNDRDAEPRNSPYLEGSKTALQKMILEMNRRSARSVERTGYM